MRKFLEFALVGILVIVVGASFIGKEDTTPWDDGFNNGFAAVDDSIARMYAGYVEEWKRDVSYSFDVAEKEVYGTDPKPEPTPIGPDPDPKKCICKGTGIIKQGDGHVTPCPYHGSKFVNPLLLEK